MYSLTKRIMLYTLNSQKIPQKEANKDNFKKD